MEHLCISDSYENNNNILYISENLSPEIFKEVENKVFANKFRVGISFLLGNGDYSLITEELADKIAEVIVIGYKYAFFCERLKINGLSQLDKDLLITSLISADLFEDKSYVRAKITSINNLAIDGFFNFKLQPLKQKWAEVANYVPDFFTSNELKDFMLYLINETKGKKIKIDGNSVYDIHGNKLKKSTLLPNLRFLVFKEILLSSAKILEIKSLPTNKEEVKYIKEYFGDKILFNCVENL